MKVFQLIDGTGKVQVESSEREIVEAFQRYFTKIGVATSLQETYHGLR